MMKKSRFDLIASSYEEAIRRCPDARTDEKWIIEKLDLKPDDRVFEFAAGTGYLTLKIAPLVREIVAQDISSVTLEISRRKAEELNIRNITYYHELDPKWPKAADESFDKVVCLGGFHHIYDQVGAVQNAYRIMKKGAILVIGDFADCSPVQRYFDEVIHEHTATGHKGLFLTKSRMINIGRICDFSETHVERVDVPFIFSSEQEIGLFYQLVHALKQTQEEVLQDIKRYMGIKKEGEKYIVPMAYVYAYYKK
jgi:ubiquinone/menaquinone biosynthesis C-methylase UbiE